MNKIEFNTKDFEQDFQKLQVKDSELLVKNSIYHKLNLLTSHQPLDTEIIYPITQSLIDTFSSQNRHLVTETPEVYWNVTKPEIIDGIDHKEANKWIYKVLGGEGKGHEHLHLDGFKNFQFIEKSEVIDFCQSRDGEDRVW